MVGNNRVHGVVLSGGEGKRLRPLTYYFQKCMIPIGSRQKPLLEYTVRLLKHHNIKDLTLLVGYKREQIINFFNGGERFGVRVRYLADNPELGGSGGSIINAYKQGAIRDDETLLIYYGDILSNLNLTEMLEQHLGEKPGATLAITSGYQIPVGVAEAVGKKLVSWREKPTLPLNVGIGVLALESKVLRDLVNLSETKGQSDIMGDFVPYLIETGMPVECYSTRAFWCDVGTAELYEKLDHDLIEKVLGNLLFGEESPVRT